MENRSIIIPDIHVGSLINEYLNNNEISQAKLARSLKLDAAYLNRLLKKNTIETDRLLDICLALKHNFFAEFCNDSQAVSLWGDISKPEISLGVQIERRLKELKMSQAVFAAKLGVTQPDVSRILRKESFDTGKLTIISRFLEYNFFHEFYSYVEPNNGLTNNQLFARYEELIIENDRLKKELVAVKAENEELKKKIEINNKR